MSESPTPRPKPRLAPWLTALAVLAVAAVAFGAAQLLDDEDGGGSAGTAPTFAEVPPATTATAPQLTLTESVAETSTEPPSSKPGVLEVAGNDLYPSLNGNLAGFAGQQVEGTAVQVLEVNGTSSFWVGRSNQRLLVVLNLKREPFPQLQPGEQVDLVGEIRPNQGAYDVSETGSKALLARQGHHAFVSVFDLEQG